MVDKLIIATGLGLSLLNLFFSFKELLKRKVREDNINFTSFSLSLAILSTVIIFIKIKQIGFTGLLISISTGILIFLLSLVLNDEKTKKASS